MPKPSSPAAALAQRNRELSILNAIAESLNRSVDLSHMLETALTQVGELFALHTGWIWLRHPTTGETYLAAVRCLPPALAQNPHSMEGSCYCLDTYNADDLEGAANVNVITCTRLKNLIDGTDGLRYHASIPLQTHACKLGVLNVASADWAELSPADLRLLHTVGDLLSIAIERAYLFARSAALGAVEERNRLAREMHDTLAQGLTAITLHLEAADALLSDGGDLERVQHTVRRALALTQANLEETRRSVLDLRAAPLEGRTLAEALAHLAAEARPSGPPITLQTTGAHQPLPPRVEVGVYRIAQEALANAVRHAQAQQIELRLTITPTTLRLEIEDDGCGFALDHVPADRFGLVGLNERVKLLGGTLVVETSPEAGTRLVITLPLHQA